VALEKVAIVEREEYFWNLQKQFCTLEKSLEAKMFWEFENFLFWWYLGLDSTYKERNKDDNGWDIYLFGKR
jgi:hypothetical protein